MCLPFGGDDEGRDLMGNLVPPNQKARDLKTTLEIILGVHFFVAILKMVIIGIFSGISDLFSCLILWCGLCRFDYCNMLIYLILVIFDMFQLLVVLGFYFQTEKGKKLPRKKKNGTYEDPEADKEDKNHPKSASEKQDELDRKEREKKKQDYEKQKSDENRQDMSERDKERDEDRERAEKKKEGVESDPHGTGGFIKKPPAFVIGVILALVIFYIVAIYYAFQAYKEFKGIAEDTAGGPENLNEGANIMAYGTLEPRQQRDRARQDARNRQGRRGGGNANSGANIHGFGNNNNENQPRRRPAFQGEGQRLGGE